MGRKKNEKELKRRYGKLVESMAEYYDHLDLRRIDDLDDERFDYIIQNLKGAGMLDLDETEISNDSIKLLSKLEYIKELRLKSCRNIDNGSIHYLSKLASLELLHVKGTRITIDGLLELESLPNLHTLLFSDEEQEKLPQKMLRLKEKLPGCSFVVNGTPWSFGNP